MHAHFVCPVTYHEGASPHDNLDWFERNLYALSGGRKGEVYLYH